MKQNHTPSSRRTVGTSRLAVGVSAVAAGLALLLTPLGASGQTTDDVTAQTLGNVITVTQTPSGVGGNCVPASVAILNGTVVVQPFSDATTFQLNVRATAPLCEPLTAQAVVYTMPSNGDTFPQQLNETKDISIQEAGDTLIVFKKECDRVQYDLVTGAPPAVLNTGFDHQLLFPANLETAFQHVGNAPDCVAASTTAAPTTTADPTTTAVDLGTTTIVAPTTIPRQVLAATTVPASSNNNAGLAVTGTTTSGPIALMGGGLVFIGLSFMLAARRRTA